MGVVFLGKQVDPDPDHGPGYIPMSVDQRKIRVCTCVASVSFVCSRFCVR